MPSTFSGEAETAAEINKMEAKGWAVRQLVVLHMGIMVIYERESDES